MFKNISSADVHYENGEINSIDGIIYKNGNFILDDSYDNTIIYKEIINYQTTNYLFTGWEKYKNNLLKNEK